MLLVGEKNVNGNEYYAMRQDGLEVALISFRENADVVKRAVKERGYIAPVLLDENGDVTGRAYGVWGPPDRNPWLTLLVAAVIQRGHVPPGGGDPFGPGGPFSLPTPDANRELLSGAGFTEQPLAQPAGQAGSRRQALVPVSNAMTGATSALPAPSFRYWSRNGRRISLRKVSAVSLPNRMAPSALPSRISWP